MARKIARLHTDDVNLNRAMDYLVAALNPVLARPVLSDDPLPVVTGSKGGNAALGSLVAALAKLGLVKDETT